MAHYYAFAEEVDTWQEHCDYEDNARFDYLSEAYGATARDANDFAADEQRFYDGLSKMIGPMEELYIQFHDADCWNEMEAMNNARAAYDAEWERYGEAMQAWALGGSNPEDRPSAPDEQRTKYAFDLPF